MKIEINNEDSNVNKILSYSDNWFKLNDRLIRTNMVISKNHLHEDLLTDNFQDFALQHLQKITSWHPEIILIGTGKTNNLPNFEWAAHANKNNIGLKNIPPPIPDIPEINPSIPPIKVEIATGIFL